MIDEWVEKWEIFKNETRNFTKEGKIKECFIGDSTCDGKIVQAHSLQKNNVLTILEEEFKSNNIILGFNSIERNGHGQYLNFKPIGKKEASTFFGFCSKHDTEIFSVIENNPVDINIEQHKFLLCLRAMQIPDHADPILPV